MAQRMSAAGLKVPILSRLDSGFNSMRVMRCSESCNQAGPTRVDWLIEWDLR